MVEKRRLTRVITSHMHRANDDDSSVDFNKIKPVLDSLRNSEVLKALNDELKRTREEKKKKEERNWTVFLQKPERPVPKVKSGYHGWVDAEEEAKVRMNIALWFCSPSCRRGRN